MFGYPEDGSSRLLRNVGTLQPIISTHATTACHRNLITLCLNECGRNEPSLHATGSAEARDDDYNRTPRQFHSSGVSPRSLGSLPDKTMELVLGAVLKWRVYRRICSVFPLLITIQLFFHTHLYPYTTSSNLRLRVWVGAHFFPAPCRLQ